MQVRDRAALAGIAILMLVTAGLTVLPVSGGSADNRTFVSAVVITPTATPGEPVAISGIVSPPGNTTQVRKRPPHCR